MEICLIHTPKKALIELQRMYQCGLHAIQPMNQYLSMHLQNFANSLCITTCGSTSFSGVGIVIGVMNDRADNQQRVTSDAGVISHRSPESWEWRVTVQLWQTRELYISVSRTVPVLTVYHPKQDMRHWCADIWLSSRLSSKITSAPV